MGAGKNAERLRRLVNMSPPVAAAEYRPPPEAECFVENVPVLIDSDEKLAINLWYHHNQLVRFCVELMIRDEGRWEVVARVDTCHGKVHRHEMTRAGGETTHTIVVLPTNDDKAARVILDQEYVTAHAELTDRCEYYVERWRTT